VLHLPALVCFLCIFWLFQLYTCIYVYIYMDVYIHMYSYINAGLHRVISQVPLWCPAVAVNQVPSHPLHLLLLPSLAAAHPADVSRSHFPLSPPISSPSQANTMQSSSKETVIKRQSSAYDTTRIRLPEKKPVRITPEHLTM